MIKIEKGKAPSEVVTACREKAEQLGKLYQAMVELHKEKVVAGQPIKLASSDYDRLIWAFLDEKATSKNRARLRKKLPALEFKSETVESLTPVELPEDLEQFKDAWRARLGQLTSSYQKLRERAEGHWRGELTQSISVSLVPNAVSAIPAMYEQRALLAGQPFLDLAQAREPSWFSQEQIHGWISTTNDDQRERAAALALFGRYQAVLNTLRQECLAGPDSRWLTPMVWMCPVPATPPGPEVLWSYAKSTMAARGLRMASLGQSMTAIELADLHKVVRPIERDAAWFFLSMRALGEVLTPDTEPARTTTERPVIGFKSSTFDSSYYSGRGIKEALMNVHHGKCAFCESKVRATGYGDVEHFRPKAGYTQDHAFRTGGYFWKAYAWENLYLSCQVCNQEHKKTYFPTVVNPLTWREFRRTYHDQEVVEWPLLVDPGVEEPRELIRFDPRTGLAYPFDLLVVHLAQVTAGLATPITDAAAAQRLLWREPWLIPDASRKAEPAHHAGRASGSGLRLDQDGWVRAHAAAPTTALRGVGTIRLLGLNRPELVLRRVAHLQGLRGLFAVTQLADHPERAQAQTALARAVEPEAEYTSLSIDAVATWTAEVEQLSSGSLTRPHPWLRSYQQRLADPPYYFEVASDLFKPANIMYFIPDAPSNTSGQRKLVLLPEKKEIDGTASPSGWFIAVPKEDSHLRAVDHKGATESIKNLRKRKRTTFNEMTVTGPFSTEPDFGS